MAPARESCTDTARLCNRRFVLGFQVGLVPLGDDEHKPHGRKQR